MKCLYVCLLLLIGTALARGLNWSFCNTTIEAIKVDSLKVSPDNPKKGDKVTVLAIITVENETIDSGSIAVNASLDGIPLPIKHSFDLCTESKIANVDCPIKPGQMNLTADPTITDLAPPGNYVVKAKITDQKEKEILCIEAKFKL